MTHTKSQVWDFFPTEIAELEPTELYNPWSSFFEGVSFYTMDFCQKLIFGTKIDIRPHCDTAQYSERDQNVQKVLYHRKRH